MKSTVWLVLALLLAAPLMGMDTINPTPNAPVAAVLQYLSPADGSPFIQPGATIALRLNGPIDPRTAAPARFSLVGSLSGPHTGRTQIADDHATVVFLPSAPFAAGETVTLNIGPGLATQAGAVFAGRRTSFHISAGGADRQAAARVMSQAETATASANNPPATAPTRPNAAATRPQDYVTFPADFPAYTVTVPASGTAPGLLFMAPINVNSPAAGNFLFIADDSGEPVYWQRTGQQFFDFKEQPDGSLTYFNTYQNKFIVLNNAYSETKAIGPANGYQPDFHELQILPNGHALFIINDPEITSTLSFGGYPTATVVGQIIQELDTNGLPVFQWDSWSHFALTDTYVSLTTTVVDYVHMNALELDQDNNILVSSRHLSEITKIDYNSGNILWRMGGKNNQFDGFQNDPDGAFACQHDIRRLANGNVTLFDNHNPGACSQTGGGAQSRAVEYQIDETNKVVTNTWEYQNPLGNFAPFTGNNQRLPDGHRFVDWGYSFPSMSEVLTDGTKLFEMTFGAPYFSYRAFRSPWAAVPEWSPTLVFTNTQTATLYYSWNGATDVASYNIYGGVGVTPNVLLGNQPRTGFEDHTVLASLPAGYCAFRVQPVNHAHQTQPFSNVVYTLNFCPAQYLPIIFR